MLLGIAAGLQILVAAANLPAKRILSLDADLSRLPLLPRQFYRVQHAYIVGILLFFGGVTIFRPSDIAPGGPLAAFLAVFWGARLVVQRFYYDPQVLRRHRWADTFFTLAFAFLTLVFAARAAGALP
jgi:hypothetical protein